ncbi:MAG: DUF882 domain-containing protein [Rhodospirillaceae bacterium]
MLRGPVSRRGFIALSAGVASFVSATPVFASPKSANRRSLFFYNLHSHEKLKVSYWEDGAYVPSAMQEIAHVLRDRRSGDVHAIDPKLLDTLFHLRRALVKDDVPTEIISGYRSPDSNSSMRAGGNRGVAKKSFHMLGMAMDMNLPGVELRQIRNQAVALKAGGVGYYPRSGFVHLDSGTPRAW